MIQITDSPLFPFHETHFLFFSLSHFVVDLDDGGRLKLLTHALQ
jgi:hypothetical protein